MTKWRVVFKGVTAFGIAMLVAAGAGAQQFSELDRALGKADPAGELVANFNELVAAAANIGSAPPTDEDRATAARVRATLQDPTGIARARDQAQRGAAQASPNMQQIPALAAKLQQGIGSRLSSDASAGMSRDFKAVAEYMAIVAPNDGWYCSIGSLKTLLGC